MLIFQFLVYPWIVKRVGLTRSQRWSSCISIPVFLAYPLLRRLRDSKGVLMAASLILLLFTNMAISTVGATPASINYLSRACSYCWEI